jgi:hypothetical protein
MSIVYKIYKSKTIIENQNQIISDLEYVKNKNFFSDYTWDYAKYNIFTLNPNSVMLNKIFLELKFIIRDYLQTDEPLWVQSWLNFHYENEVLQRHSHEWPYHGYISIEPNNTTTVFDNFEIKNEIGNIYIGQGNLYHSVRVDKSFKEPRITLGFDIKTKDVEVKKDMVSLIPI